ncbi:hypothetical protein FQA39_LY07327 [Lamprigera yunnana]|nr:hypothetical protein FQA39_LY07327 [Lamprigera yunnana]
MTTDEVDVNVNTNERKKPRKRGNRCNCIIRIPARLILYFLTLTGVAVLYIMSTIMPITLLAMVKGEFETITNVTLTKKCYDYNDDNTLVKNVDYSGDLDWSINVQYYVLSSFYWTYLIAQVVGGIASQRLGDKTVVGYGLFVSSLCNFCIPLVSNVHYVLVILLQIIHGFAQGVVWPSLYSMVSSWIPVNERARFITSLEGLSTGASIGPIMAGFIITKFGWTYVFIMAGGLGLLWSAGWYFLAYNKPETHPNISRSELTYIQKHRNRNNEKSNKSIPWKSILLSLPVWAIAITSFGRSWLQITLNIYGSLYLKTAIGLDVTHNGFGSGLPRAFCLFASLCFSYISDKLLDYKGLSVVRNRKFFAGIGQLIPGILSICFGYLECNITLTALTWFLLHILPTANFVSSMVNSVDLTPSFTGPTMAFVQILLMSPSIFTTLVAKNVIQADSTYNAWSTIFVIAGVVNIISYSFYFMFASAKVSFFVTFVNFFYEVDVLKLSENITFVKIAFETNQQDADILSSVQQWDSEYNENKAHKEDAEEEIML